MGVERIPTNEERREFDRRLRKCGLKVDPSMLEYYARDIRRAIRWGE